MPYKEPSFHAYIVPTAAAFLGCLARWFESQVFAQEMTMKSVCLLVLDLFISAGLGILAFHMVVDMGQPESFGAGAAAMIGNIGARAFDLVLAIFSKQTGVKEPEEKK